MAWQNLNTIVVPYDFSVHSKVALDKALEIAESTQKIHVIHVLAEFIPLAPEGYPVEFVDDTLRVEQAERLLKAEFEHSKYEGIKTSIAIGDPGTVCAEYAETNHADLIIIPSHGRTGLSRLLLGSVAERIVRLAHCPVLVLKLPHA